MINRSRQINDADDFNSWAEAMLTDFCQSIVSAGMTRPITEGDGVDPEKYDFIYSDRANKLIERYIHRMARVGNRHFPDGYIEVSSYCCRELE